MIPRKSVIFNPKILIGVLSHFFTKKKILKSKI